MSLLFLLILFPSFVFAAPDAPSNVNSATVTWDTGEAVQRIFYDENYENWYMDLYLGNLNSKNKWYDGPRNEVGGPHRPMSSVDINNKVYLSFAPESQVDSLNVTEVDRASGTARLYMHWTGKYIGDREEVAGNYMFYDAGNDTTYLIGPNCLRKIVNDTVSLVAGECGTECVSSCDGSGSAARFYEIKGWAAPGDGNVYLLSSPSEGSFYFRKVTSTGVVTTHELTRSEGTPVLNFINATYDTMSESGDPNILYIADHYSTIGTGIVELNLSTYALTRVAGVPTSNDAFDTHGNEIDGPATTQCNANGGFRGLYSSFYNKYFLDANDSQRLRVLTTEDGQPWCKTIAYSQRPWYTGSSSVTMSDWQGGGLTVEEAYQSQGYVIRFVGYDNAGGLYFRSNSENTVLFRVYNSVQGGVE